MLTVYASKPIRLVTMPPRPSSLTAKRVGFFLGLRQLNKHSIEIESRVAAFIEAKKANGLIVDDDGDGVNSLKKALHYVARVGPHRFDEYFEALRRHYEAKGIDQVELSDVLKVYKFDRKLRLLALDALERIEITTKGLICAELAEAHGEQWLKKRKCCIPANLRKELAINIQRTLRIRIGSEKSLTECYKTTDVGLICDSMTFGQMSKAYRNLGESSQRRIAGVFRTNPSSFQSWMLSLTHLRNDAAHHMVVWNKRYKTQPKIPGSITMQFGEIQVSNDFSGRVFGQFLVTFYLVQCVARKTRWHQRLYSLLNSHDLIPEHLDTLEIMRFPDNWHEMPFWNGAAGSTI